MTDTTNESPQLFAANEIMGAALTVNMSKTDTLAFASDPKSFISSSLNLDTGDISVSVVENDSATLHLALPYYTDLERLSAGVLKDADIDDVAGGEIIISILAIAGAIGGGVAAAAITGTALSFGTAAVVTGAIIGTGVGVAAGVGAVAGIGVGGAQAAAAAGGKNLDGSKK